MKYVISDTELIKFLIKYKDSGYEEWNYVDKFLKSKTPIPEPDKGIRDTIEKIVCTIIEDVTQCGITHEQKYVSQLSALIPDRDRVKELIYQFINNCSIPEHDRDYEITKLVDKICGGSDE